RRARRGCASPPWPRTRRRSSSARSRPSATRRARRASSDDRPGDARRLGPALPLAPVHADGGLARRGAAGDRRGGGLYARRHARAALPGWCLLALVQRARPPASGARCGAPRPAGARRPLYAPRARQRALDRARSRADRDRAARADPRLLLRRGRHRGRGRAAHRAPVPPAARRAGAHALHALAHRHGTVFIADEVATGFGRTGLMFACEHAGITPDLMCLAKGISGGYLPLAATLATEEVFAAFLGPYEEFRAFFHGHTYTGNPLGCAVALASLRLFREERTLERLAPKIARLRERLAADLAPLEHVGDVRQQGFMVGVALAAGRAGRVPH